MADKIVVMHDGIVEQIGAPLELYDQPDNLFVAGFIGSPAMNFLKGRIGTNGRAAFEGPGGVVLPLAPAGGGRGAAGRVRHPARALRDRGRRRRSRDRRRRADRLGNQVFAKLGGEDIVAVFRERHKFNPGDRIRIRPDPRFVHCSTTATGKRLQ